MRDKKVIAIIPARGGSKGLPRKNILDLGGKPLIAWTIEAAKKCELIDKVVVNTDDKEIAEISTRYGADVPFLRPGELAGDFILSEDVLLNTIQWLEENENDYYDIVVYLQATDPFREKNIIYDVTKKLLENEELDTVFAAYPDHKNYWLMTQDKYEKVDGRGHEPRQKKVPIFREDTGIACATRIKVVKNKKRIGDNVLIIPHTSPFHFIDIHDEIDLKLANVIIREFSEYI